MTYPEIKLVDAPTATATVLFDFNDDTATPKREVTADDFSIGVPELDGDVDAVDPLYSERIVSFVCAMTGTKPQVAAAQSTLARRLLAPGQGWLRVQVTPTSRLLFFRTYRPQPGDLSFELVQTTSAAKSERWELSIVLPCEPFAYGERVTQSVQTVNNDPAAGVNPVSIVLPTVTGDAPTRLRVQVSGASVDQAGYRHMFGLTSAPTTRLPSVTQIGTGDGALIVPAYDTTAPVTDSTYSNGSYRATTFATNTAHARRMDLLTTPMLPGRYQVLVRIARPRDAATRFTLSASLSDGAAIGTAMTPTVTTNATNAGSGFNATWVNLGVLGHQARSDPDNPTARTTFVGLFAGRAGGTGDLRWDAVMFVPVSDSVSVRGQTLFAGYDGGPYTNSGGASGSNVNTFDGDTEAFWSNTGISTCSIGPAAWPTANPDSAHVLTVLTHVNPDFNGTYPTDAITTSIQVTVSYLPRFLYVGDS